MYGSPNCKLLQHSADLFTARLSQSNFSVVQTWLQKCFSLLSLQENVESELVEKLSVLLMKASSLVSDPDSLKDVVNSCLSSGNC